MAEDNKEKSSENLMDRLNTWSLSDNPFAKFVRFVAQTVYSVGIVTSGFVMGVTNTLLGKQVVNREAAFDQAMRADKKLKETLKQDSKPNKDVKENQKEESEKTCEQMNHETFVKSVTSKYAVSMYKNAGLHVVLDEKNKKIEFYSNDDKKVLLGKVSEQEFLNGDTKNLSKALFENSLIKDGLQAETLPPDLMEEYTNKSNLHAAIMQGSMFLEQNNKNLKEIYAQYQEAYGTNPDILKNNFSVSTCYHEYEGKKVAVDIVYEPERMNGFSIYRNGVKFSSYSMNELTNDKLMKIVAKTDKEIKEINQSISERALVFGDIMIQRTGSRDMCIINTNSMDVHEMNVLDAESIVKDIEQIRSCGMLKDTALEKLDAAMITTCLAAFEIPYSQNTRETEKGGEWLNPVSGTYESLQEMSYSIRKEKENLVLVKQSNEPSYKQEMQVEASNMKEARKEFKKLDQDICSMIYEKTDVDYSLKGVASNCLKSAEECFNNPGQVIAVEGVEEISLYYDKKNEQILILREDGEYIREDIVASMPYERASEQEIYQFAQELQYLDKEYQAEIHTDLDKNTPMAEQEVADTENDLLNGILNENAQDISEQSGKEFWVEKEYEDYLFDDEFEF